MPLRSRVDKHARDLRPLGRKTRLLLDDRRERQCLVRASGTADPCCRCCQPHPACAAWRCRQAPGFPRPWSWREPVGVRKEPSFRKLARVTQRGHHLRIDSCRAACRHGGMIIEAVAQIREARAFDDGELLQHHAPWSNNSEDLRGAGAGAESRTCRPGFAAGDRRLWRVIRRYSSTARGCRQRSLLREFASTRFERWRPAPPGSARCQSRARCA